jgi:methionyl-tRNA formyltransferase
VTRKRADGSRVRTVFLGSGAFGVPVLHALADHPAIDLVGVVTAPARPSGRNQAITSTVVDRHARALGVDPILTPARLRDPAAIGEVIALGPELAVLADYGQLVPGGLLHLPYAALNLHPSLLPRHRGATPIPAAILAGDPRSGVTLIQMDEGLDTGPIIGFESLPLDGTETAPELEEIMAGMSAHLLAERLGPWLSGDLRPTPQGDDGSSLTRPLRREDGRLDPGLPAARLERRVRAYQPWPGAFFDTTRGRVAVLEAADVDGDGRGPAGTLDAIGLATADGRRLALRLVRPAGGRPMTWGELMRGRPDLLGSSVASSS